MSKKPRRSMIQLASTSAEQASKSQQTLQELHITSPDVIKNEIPRPATNKVVIGVHGIFSAGAWVQQVGNGIEGIATVKGLHYNVAGLVKLWFPFGPRHKAVSEVRRKLQEYCYQYRDSEITVIAHSFGTYLTCEALKGFGCKIHRLILCGSILPLDYAFHAIESKIDGRMEDGSVVKIVNEVGSSDIWPPFAQAFSWGYGDIGTQGAGSTYVIDRFHDGGHGQFSKAAFIERFWAPLIANQSVEKDKLSPAPKWWLLYISIFPLKYVILATLMWLIVLGGDLAIRGANSWEMEHTVIGKTDFQEVSTFRMPGGLLEDYGKTPWAKALPRKTINAIADSLKINPSPGEMVAVGCCEFESRTSAFAFKVELPEGFSQVKSYAFVVRGGTPQNRWYRWYDPVFQLEALFGLPTIQAGTIISLPMSEDGNPVGSTVDAFAGDQLWVLVRIKAPPGLKVTEQDLSQMSAKVSSWPRDDN